MSGCPSGLVDAAASQPATRQADAPTAVLSIHSFTPSYHGQARPWHAGVIARGLLGTTADGEWFVDLGG